MAMIAVAAAEEPTAELRAAAEKGDPEAQHELAEIYRGRVELGEAGNFDLENAEDWHRRAATRGFLESQYGLARTLMLNVRTNQYVARRKRFVAVHPTEDQYGTNIVAEAMEWYRITAQRGFAPAQLELARQYEVGTNIPKDYAEALKWSILAANGSPNDDETRKYRNALSAAMSSGDVAEGRERAARFSPQQNEEQALPGHWKVRMLKLQGLGGTPTRRFALISGQTFEVGDCEPVRQLTKYIKIGHGIKVCCVAINQSSVRISIWPWDREYELTMVIPPRDD